MKDLLLESAKQIGEHKTVVGIVGTTTTGAASKVLEDSTAFTSNDILTMISIGVGILTAVYMVFGIALRYRELKEGAKCDTD